MSQKQKEFHRQLDGNAAIPAKPPADPATPHPKQVEAMKVFEHFQRTRRFGMSADILKISSELVPKHHKLEQIPEAIFVNYFLPLFAGEVQETVDINYNTWFEKVSGGDTAAVEVIDENHNVLFVVPGFMETSVIELTRPGGPTMTRIERQYSRLKEVDAAASQVFLSKTLEGIHIKDKPTQKVIDNIKTWNAIFVRYGREDKILSLGNILEHDTKKEETTPVAGKPVSDNDVGDYEMDYD